MIACSEVATSDLYLENFPGMATPHPRVTGVLAEGGVADSGRAAPLPWEKRLWLRAAGDFFFIIGGGANSPFKPSPLQKTGGEVLCHRLHPATILRVLSAFFALLLSLSCAGLALLQLCSS